MDQSELNNCWDEELSKEFIDYGRYFVPDRQYQIETIVHLLQHLGDTGQFVELCCGEGLLAEAILARYPDVHLTVLDGSQVMLDRASKRLDRFGDRFQPQLFDIADQSWRIFDVPIQAVVTSLAVHHLPGPEKERLFSDIYKMLAPGGVFIIADIIDPIHPVGRKLAAAAYDDVVWKRSLQLGRDTEAFNFFKREGWNIFRMLDPEDIDKPSPLFDQLKWLEKAGFRQVDVFWMRAGHAIFGGWVPLE